MTDTSSVSAISIKFADNVSAISIKFADPPLLAYLRLTTLYTLTFIPLGQSQNKSSLILSSNQQELLTS